MAKKEKNILNDIMQYCARAEHCTQDVVRKLKSWEVEEEEIEGILDQLREENFIDDARYAKAYINDKWKLDHWGKRKIRHQLFLKNIDDALIQTPLSAIDDEEYKTELAAQLSRKEKELKGEDKNNMVNKLFNFGVSRGFEEELIMKWLQARSKNVRT
jgi:regulatory protein